MDKIKEAKLVKSGDTVLLINGHPPLVDCRVVAEDNYQNIMRYEALLREAVEALKAAAGHIDYLTGTDTTVMGLKLKALITKSKSILND